MKTGLRVAAICALCLLAGCGALRTDDRYALNGTQVIDYATPDGARRFKLYVGLPRNYETRAAERFPVIYLLDADYSFALTRNLLRHFTDRGQAQDSIIVGIAYEGAEDDIDVYHRTRTRDYTPSHVDDDNGYGREIQRLVSERLFPRNQTVASIAACSLRRGERRAGVPAPVDLAHAAPGAIADVGVSDLARGRDPEPALAVLRAREHDDEAAVVAAPRSRMPWL